MTQEAQLTRRSFLAGTLAATSTALSPIVGFAADSTSDSRFPICAFIKFLQSMSYDDLAAAIAELGFDGIEATVRNGGHVLPERAEDDLPKLVEALNKHSLKINVMASSVGSVEEPHTEKVLRTAARLGVKRYRLAGYKYDLNRPVVDQLKELKPVISDLAAFNHELGIQGVYQNHSGSKNVGAAIWDLHQLIQDERPEDIGIAYDIRHATVEGGLCWPINFNLMQPHLGAVYVKDFRWDGRRAFNVPLGTGQVDPAFFKQLRQSDYHGPISLHVEYLREAGIDENLAALKTDLKTLHELLAG